MQSLLPEVVWFVFPLSYILSSEWFLGLVEMMYLIIRRSSSIGTLFMELLLSALVVREVTKTSTNATEPLPFHLLL